MAEIGLYRKFWVVVLTPVCLVILLLVGFRLFAKFSKDAKDSAVTPGVTECFLVIFLACVTCDSLPVYEYSVWLCG